MTMPPLHTLGMHANHMARCTSNERMQAILHWVGVGSVIMMGMAAGAHLIRDLTKPHAEWQPEPYPRHKALDLRDEMKRHYRDPAMSK